MARFFSYFILFSEKIDFTVFDVPLSAVKKIQSLQINSKKTLNNFQILLDQITSLIVKDQVSIDD